MTSDYSHYKAEYKQENNGFKKILEKLLPKYDSMYGSSLQSDSISEYRHILYKTRKFFPHHISNDDKTAQMHSFTIPHMSHEPAYFTFMMMMQTVQYIPHAFKLLNKRLSLGNFNQVEYVPCYMLDLNHIALIKLDQKKGDASEYNSNNELYQKLIPQSGRRIRLSSTGILRYGSGRRKKLVHAKDQVKRCFDLCYWCLPQSKAIRDSCIHNLIYHRMNDIVPGGIVRIRKTIVQITSLSGVHTMNMISPRSSIKYRQAKVLTLMDRDHVIVSEKKSMFLEKNLSYSLKPGDMINAIIVEQKAKNPKFSMIIGMAGPVIQPGDIDQILGLVLWKRLQDIQTDSNITQVGSIRNISGQLSDLFKSNSDEGEIFYPSFAWQKSGETNNVKRVISTMFPMYVVKSDMVHQLSPTMLSFLAAYDPSMLSNKKAIESLIQFLNILQVNSNKWHEKSPSSLTQIVGERHNVQILEFLLENLPKLMTRMVHSRILSNY